MYDLRSTSIEQIKKLNDDHISEEVAQLAFDVSHFAAKRIKDSGISTQDMAPALASQ